ncbi:MAG TPA: hypothetical protein VGI40_12765 [Pirellulaceae bacterium]|jgi:hypothetical protein
MSALPENDQRDARLPNSQFASGSTFRIRNTRGSTLMELVTAVSISSFLVVGLSSAVMISLDTLTTSQTNSGTSIQTSQTLDRLVTELQSAVFVSERTGTTLGFTIPDQNGDGAPERVRYAWTGAAGGSLTRQYNGGTPQTLVTNVDLFTLTPSYKSVPETYPSVGVEDATESVIIDYSGSSSLGNNSVTSTNWLGQYFTLTLPAGCYAWRPTSVSFMAKVASTPGQTWVQARLANASCLPVSTVNESYNVTQGQLATNYAWTNQPFTSLPPIASGGAVCLILQWKTGTTAMTVESCNNYTNMLKSTNSGASWSLDNSKCLVSQLYGKLTRSSGSQTLNSKYLTSMAIALRPTGSTSTQQGTAPLYNHPEMLNAKWELDFSKNPTTVDINGDNAMDMVVHGGGTFDSGKFTVGQWQSSGVQQLDTSPGNDFAKTSIIDVKLQNTTVGGNGAVFSVNALRSGANCAPVLAYLTLQSDGTQTLTVSTKTDDATPKTLIYIPGLPAQATMLHLIIDPTSSAVSVTVNDVQKGTFPLTPYPSSDTSRSASITGSGSNAAFTYFRVRVLEQ